MKRTIAVLLAISFFACNMNYEKTPSGLTYKIIKGKGGEKPKPGEFIKFNVEYKLEDRDSVLQSTFTGVPAYGSLDTGKRTEYTYMEVLPLMSEGDSAVVSISIDSLKNKGMIADYTPILVKGQVLTAKVKLIKVFKNEKDVLADYNKEMESEKASEAKAIEQYMTKNNLKGIKTKNGAYVVVENPGDQSNKADSGKMVTVMYRGYLVSNGKIFDTNMDTTKGHTDPLQFVVGTPNSAIAGFSEGMPYFGKGGKGKILVPAMLGYGPQAMPDLPPFSNLVFDIEVTDVADAPPQQGNPMLQQQLQEQLQKLREKQDSTAQKH